LGIPDHPASNQSSESWLVETSKYLRKESKAFAKLEREFKEDILFNDHLKSFTHNPNLKKCLSILLRFPRRLVRASLRRFLRNISSEYPD
jgi:hypothetical protein